MPDSLGAIPTSPSLKLSPFSAPQTLVSEAPLCLDQATFYQLLTLQGPSLGLWRAAEVAALREQVYEPPVLDLGCGDGFVTAQVLSNVAIALDPDAQVLAKAAQQGIYEQCLALPIQRAPLSAGSIGTIVSNSVLEHIPHIEAALEAIARLLKVGGRLIFTAPTDAFSDWLAFPWQPYATWRNQQLAHLNLWSAARWSEKLAEVGLQVEVVRPYLRREWVSLWDGLELLQQLWIARYRLVGVLWKQIPPDWLSELALQASQIDLSAPTLGGGHLLVARKI